MSATFKPGQIVHHAAYGTGIVITLSSLRRGVMYAVPEGVETTNYLTGWKPVYDVVKPGHVQVRVDDLPKQTLSEWSQWTACHAEDEALIRLGRAFVARQIELGDPPTESHTEPANSETVTDPGTPKLTEAPDSEYRRVVTRNIDLLRSAMAIAKKETTQPTATVSLPCPDCGEAITRGVRTTNTGRHRWTLELLPGAGPIGERAHRCQPAQPDEPQEFGARVTVTTPDGRVEKWVRADGYVYSWRRAGGHAANWEGLVRCGQVSLDWDDAE